MGISSLIYGKQDCGVSVVLGSNPKYLTLFKGEPSQRRKISKQIIVPTFGTLYTVVRPEYLRVGRLPSKDDLFKQRNVFPAGNVSGRPVGIQLAEAPVGVKGHVVGGMPVLGKDDLGPDGILYDLLEIKV